MIKVQYGASVKDVQLPYNLNTAGFEECLQHVFTIKGKSLYGLRYPMENVIFDLDNDSDKLLLLKRIKESPLPLIPVFHNIISNYKQKEVLLEYDAFCEFLSSIHCNNPLKSNDVNCFFQCCFGNCTISDFYQILQLSQEGELTDEQLYNAFLSIVETPFSNRLRSLFHLIDNKRAGYLTEVELLHLFELLYWEEVCCYVTGKLCLHTLLHFRNQAQFIMKQFQVDHKMNNHFMLEPIHFWLLNRGNEFFSEQFYASPSLEILQLSELPLPSARILSTMNVLGKQQQVEALFFLFPLFSSLYRMQNPVVDIADIISQYINESMTISESDFITCMYEYFQIDDSASEVVTLTVHRFCDTIMLVLSDAFDCIRYLDIFIVFSLLSFMETSDLRACSEWLIDYLCEDELVSGDVIFMFIQTIVSLLNTIVITENEDNIYMQPNSEQMTLITTLFKQILDFTSESNIQKKELRETAVSAGTSRNHFMIMVQYLFISIPKLKNVKSIIASFSSLFANYTMDSIVDFISNEENIHEDLSFSFDKKSFIRRITCSTPNHITLFSSSNLGILYHYVLYMLGNRLHLNHLHIIKLLHIFSKYDHFDGSTDNMYFSEYSSFIQDLLEETEQSTSSPDPFYSTLFDHLCHNESTRINRYEMIICIALFTDELYHDNNGYLLWSLLQVGSSIPDHLISFTYFSNAIVTLTCIFFPSLFSNLQKQLNDVTFDINKHLCTTCGSNYPINESDFLKNAPSSFHIDDCIRQGNGLLNTRVEKLLSSFAMNSLSYQAILKQFNSIRESSLSIKDFQKFMDHSFPLPPFSAAEVKAERNSVLDAYCKAFSNSEGEIDLLPVKASFSSIVIDNRNTLWNEVIALIAKEDVVNKLDVLTILRAMISMSLLVYVDTVPAHINEGINCILSTLTIPTSVSTLKTMFYDHIDLLLPASYSPTIFSRPTVLYCCVMNLRYCAALGNMLFSRLISIINSSSNDSFTLGEYYQFIEDMVKDIHIDKTIFIEVYQRIYTLLQHLQPSTADISKRSLLLLLSSVYPNNNALIQALFEQLAEDGGITFSSFKFYLNHVYHLINEFFECFDLTLITLEQVALKVSLQCFETFALTSEDSLTREQFTQWMHQTGAYDIVHVDTPISHYTPIRSNAVKVTYNLLSESLFYNLFDPKEVYNKDRQRGDLQIYIDRLTSYANGMNFHQLNDEMKQILYAQKDPRGDIACSIFVRTLSSLILNQYVNNENEARELILEVSTNLKLNEKELEPIREGLTTLYNCLNITNSFVPANQLIGLLCLLSEGPINVRLKRMITETCQVEDDAVYLHEVDMIISAFYLFLDILFPEVTTAEQNTPLHQTSKFYSHMKANSDKNLVEINTVLHLLYQVLSQRCHAVKQIQVVTRQYPSRLDHYLQSFSIKLQSTEKFLFPFLINNIAPNRECNFFTEEYIREKKFEHGLFDQKLNEVLCRDFIRRTFILWKVNFPPHFLEAFLKILFSLVGQDHLIQFNDIMAILMSFATLPQNSVAATASLYFSVIKQIVRKDCISFTDLEHYLYIAIKVWLHIIRKESLLSEAQVHALLTELLSAEEESTIYIHRFVGNCVVQSLNPSSLNMQRMMACLFHSCDSVIRLIWEGEMP